MRSDLEEILSTKSCFHQNWCWALTSDLEDSVFAIQVTFYVQTQPKANISSIVNAKTSTLFPFLKCCNHGCCLFLSFFLSLFVYLFLCLFVSLFMCFFVCFFLSFFLSLFLSFFVCLFALCV